jgi:hypothetical protein
MIGVALLILYRNCLTAMALTQLASSFGSLKSCGQTDHRIHGGWSFQGVEESQSMSQNGGIRRGPFWCFSAVFSFCEFGLSHGSSHSSDACRRAARDDLSVCLTHAGLPSIVAAAAAVHPQLQQLPGASDS